MKNSIHSHELVWSAIWATVGTAIPALLVSVVSMAAQPTELKLVRQLPRVVHEHAVIFSTSSLKYKQFPGSADGNSVTWPVGITPGDTMLLVTATATDTGFANVELSNVYMPIESHLDGYTAVVRRGDVLVVARGIHVARYRRAMGRWIHERTTEFRRRVRAIDVVDDTTLFYDMCGLDQPDERGTNTFFAAYGNLALSWQRYVEVNPGLSAAAMATNVRLAAPIGNGTTAFIREFDGDILFMHKTGRVDTVQLFSLSYTAEDSLDLLSASERRNSGAAAWMIRLSNDLRKHRPSMRGITVLNDSTVLVSTSLIQTESFGLQKGNKLRSYCTLRLPQNGAPRVMQTIALDGTLETDVIRDVIRIGPWTTTTANGYVVEGVPYEVETTHAYTMKQFLTLADERATMDTFTFRLMARSSKELLP